MKTRILLGILLCVFLQNCKSPDRNCEQFKTGTFTFETLLEGELVATKFIRNDTLEVDYYKGKADSSSIRWINNCEYIAKKLHPKNRAEEKALHFKILTTEGDYYTFEYSLVGKNQKQRGTAQKTN